MAGIIYQYSSERFALSYNIAVASVARERKYLAATEPFPEESTYEYISHIIDENLPQFFAIDGDTVVGWCDILPKSFEGMRHVGVLGLGVIEGYRGRGIGHTLLDMTIAYAKSRSISKVELEVFASNTAAAALYEKTGFIHEGRRIRSRHLDGAYDDIILMGKEI